jgi:hypothetical protein
METLVSSPRAPGKGGRGGGGKKPPNGPAGAAHKALITRNLRLVYDEVAGEPIPDRIVHLLAQMDQKEGTGS